MHSRRRHLLQNGCSALERIHGGGNITSVGGRAFEGCGALESFDFGAGLRTVRNLWHVCACPTRPTAAYCRQKRRRQEPSADVPSRAVALLRALTSVPACELWGRAPLQAADCVRLIWGYVRPTLASGHLLQNPPRTAECRKRTLRNLWHVCACPTRPTAAYCRQKRRRPMRLGLFLSITLTGFAVAGAVEVSCSPGSLGAQLRGQSGVDGLVVSGKIDASDLFFIARLRKRGFIPRLDLCYRCGNRYHRRFFHKHRNQWQS